MGGIRPGHGGAVRGRHRRSALRPDAPRRDDGRPTSSARGRPSPRSPRSSTTPERSTGWTASTPRRTLVDRPAFGADFWSCSPYKFLGPHCGLVAADPALLETLEMDKLLPSSDDVPERFELGTLPYELMAGTTASVEFLAGLANADWDDERADRSDRRRRLVASLHALEGRGQTRRATRGRHPSDARCPGAQQRRSPDAHALFTVDGKDPQEVRTALADKGINAPASNFYAIECSRALGLGDGGGCGPGSPPTPMTRMSTGSSRPSRRSRASAGWHRGSSGVTGLARGSAGPRGPARQCRRTSRIRKDFDDEIRVQTRPGFWALIHFWRESEPRCFWTTRWATPSAARRASHRSRRCRALADVDRGIGPDRLEPHVGRHLVRLAEGGVADSRDAGVESRQLQGPAVHVDAPHVGTGRAQREGDRDGTPTAPEVEQMAVRARSGAPERSTAVPGSSRSGE